MWNRQRTYAVLVGGGIWILLTRTILMISQGWLAKFVPWVAGLLALEFLLNAGVFLTAVWWWVGATERRATLPLRLTAASVIVHAMRVAIYVLSQTGPWHDFDVRPIYRAEAVAEWHWVVFAAVLATLGLVGLTLVWRRRRNHRRSAAEATDRHP